ncbi:hypothetical protein HIM_11506 [Hirsutella minnesotensis 3608]|uniref:Uncharacterized protein n=1 Tax=Hirsutella minnesotensis 3608 TaxID=1043627 RepID=A0A0F8A131_9HYPO|nr:hypothetical protein HIM_11506 [Hirsutella minnesotensis 3608]
MPSSKDRLYIALYARGGEGYHWALLTGPKSDKPDETGTRYHAKQHNMVWEFNEQSIRMAPTNMILIRVIVAKVVDKKKLQTILRGIPVRPERPGWTCKSWVKEAFEALQNGRAISRSLDWASSSETALWYAEQKKSEHRFDGQAEPGKFDETQVATWSTLDGSEVIP